MNFSTLDNALWAAGFVGHVALVLILVIRRRVPDFPVFTGFIGFEALTTILLFVVSRYGSRHGYFIAYWITAFVDYSFQVAVILEVAHDVLRPTGTWVRDARKAFLGWGGLGLIASAMVALQVGPPQSKGFDLWDVRVTFFTSLLLCALYIAVSMVANHLGLQWRSHVVALAQGLGVWALVALIEDFGHMVFGWDRAFSTFVYIRMFSYLSVLVYWMVAFWLPEKTRSPISPEMKAYLVALHQRVQYDLKSVDQPHL